MARVSMGASAKIVAAAKGKSSSSSSDGYNSWIASRCNQATNTTSTVKKKYSSSSGSSSSDSYSRWIDERLERMRNADATNKSLINSLLSGFSSVLGILTDIPKTTTTTVKDGYSSWIADRQKKQDEVKTKVAVSTEFAQGGIYTQDVIEGKVHIKPIGEDYEVITTSDGEVVIKLSSGGQALVYNENEKAIGSANNIYGSNGIDVKGKMVIDGKEVDVRVVAGETDWGEVAKKAANEVVEGAATVGASTANAGIGLGIGGIRVVEKVSDAYLAAKAKFDSTIASGLAGMFRTFGL